MAGTGHVHTWAYIGGKVDVSQYTTALYIPPTRMPLKTLTILLSLSPVSRSVEFSRSLSRGNPNPKSHGMGSKSMSDHPRSGDGVSPGYVSLSLLLCIGLVRFQIKLWGKEKTKGRFWICRVFCMVSVFACVSGTNCLVLICFGVILTFCDLLFCETQKAFYWRIAQRNELW